MSAKETKRSELTILLCQFHQIVMQDIQGRAELYLYYHRSMSHFTLALLCLPTNLRDFG